MANIGGNITGRFQTKAIKKNDAGEIVKNSVGEAIKEWKDAVSQLGFLDLQSGDSKYTNFNAKVEESTHIFLCDFKSELYALADRDTRAIFKGIVYDVLLIDNPMEKNEQLEIYLKKVGAWDGKCQL